MGKILASLIIGICLFLSNISGQAKTFKIVDHISTHHSKAKVHHSHHHHGHKHHHHHHHNHAEKHADKSAKKSENHEHNHAIDLSVASVNMNLPSQERIIYFASIALPKSQSFVVLNTLSLLSFSPNIFRPPIA